MQIWKVQASQPHAGQSQAGQSQAWHPQGVPLHIGAGQLVYALPFYITALAAAVLTGVYAVLPGARPPFYGAIPDALLIYAVVAFGVLLFERQPRWLWLVAGFATWATLLATQQSIYYVTGIGLGTGIAGLLLGRMIQQRAVRIALSTSSHVSFTFSWGWPWYLSSLVAAVAVGSWSNLNPDLPGFAEYALLAFAVLFYLVGIIEDQLPMVWLGSLFASWSLIDSAFKNDFYRLLTIALVYSALAVLTRSLRFFPRISAARQELHSLRMALPFYATALVAAVLTGSFFGFEVNYPFYGAVAAAMLLYAFVSCGVMLYERVPEILILPVAFAAYALWLWQPQLDLASMMIAYSVLCMLIFASQFVWKVLSPSTRWIPATLLHNVLGIGGQALVVLVIIGNNGLTSGSVLLAFVGAGALFVLAAMVFCYGRIQGNNVRQRACDYTAGLLLSLVVSWVLAAFRQTNLDLLLLAPSTYLIVIAPLLLRDEIVPVHQRIGQVIAVVGAALLLLPTLWLSFSNGDANLLYTMVLMGEALLLLLLGIGVGVRSFVLSGTGLIVVGAIHALFLTTNGLPWTLTLIITGVTLLAIATVLSIAGRRLRAAWANWD